MHRFLYLIFCSVFSLVPLFGQAQFSMERYLKSALKDQSLEKYRAQIAFLDQHHFNSPWINRVELRVGSEDANISIDDYRLRLTPANPSEIKANKIYYNRQLKSINSDYQVALNKALLNRYHLLIEHYYYSQYSDALNRKKEVTDELLKMYQQNNFRGFDMKDMIDLESGKSDLLLDNSKSQMEQKEIEYYIFLDIDSSSTIDWQEISLISIEKIKEHVLRLEINSSDENIFVRKAKEQLALREQEYKVEKSEARRNIGYVQGNFDSDKGNDINDRIGFQVGLRVPIVNPDKPDLQRDQFKLIDDRDEVAEAEELIQKKSELLLIRLNGLFDQYDMINDRIASVKKIVPVIDPQKNIDAKALVEKKLYEIELSENKIQTEKEILETYIEYLNIQGMIAKPPLVNYLSPTHQSIED